MKIGSKNIIKRNSKGREEGKELKQKKRSVSCRIQEKKANGKGVNRGEKREREVILKVRKTTQQ